MVQIRNLNITTKCQNDTRFIPLNHKLCEATAIGSVDLSILITNIVLSGD